MPACLHVCAHVWVWVGGQAHVCIVCVRVYGVRVCAACLHVCVCVRLCVCVCVCVCAHVHACMHARGPRPFAVMLFAYVPSRESVRLYATARGHMESQPAP